VAFVVAAGALGELLVAVGAGAVALPGGGPPFWDGPGRPLPPPMRCSGDSGGNQDPALAELVA
jgi:hypothetical protein